MAGTYTEGSLTLKAGEALAAYRRVKVESGTTSDPVEVVYADAGEQHVGVTEYAVADTEMVVVRPRTLVGSQMVCASGAFSRGSALYGAADGKVSGTVAGSAVGIALEAATADGDIVEMLPAQFGYARGFVGVPLTSLRELTTGAIPNAAGNGGLLASDTTPILSTINGDTDGALRVSWAASNSDPVGFQVLLPPDLDDAADVVIKFRAAMAGATDTPAVSADSYFNEGDTKVEDDSAAVTGSAYAVYAITIAAADVPAGAQTLSVELTPGAHTTDALYLTAMWVEYTRAILTA